MPLLNFFCKSMASLLAMVNIVSAHLQGSEMLAVAPVTSILAVTILLIFLHRLYSYNTGPAYPGFPFVGKDEKTKTTWQLKMKWVRHAKDLIYDTLAKVYANRILDAAYSQRLTRVSVTNHSSSLLALGL